MRLISFNISPGNVIVAFMMQFLMLLHNKISNFAHSNVSNVRMKLVVGIKAIEKFCEK